MTPKTKTRRTPFILLFPLLLLSLSACVDVDASFTINEDETVDFTVTLLDLQNNITGPPATTDDAGRCEGLVDDYEPLTEAGDIKIDFIAKGGIAGCQIEGSGFSIDEINSLGYGEVFHSDGEYQVDVDGFTSLLGDSDNNATLSVTFPGDIQEAPGGEVTNDDKTVTWTSPSSTMPMNALAKDDDNSSSNPLLFLIALFPIFIAVFMSQEDEKKDNAEGASDSGEEEDGDSKQGESEDKT